MLSTINFRVCRLEKVDANGVLANVDESGGSRRRDVHLGEEFVHLGLLRMFFCPASHEPLSQDPDRRAGPVRIAAWAARVRAVRASSS